MKKISDIEFLEKTNKTLVGVLEFKDLAKKAVESTINDLDLQGAAIFRTEENNSLLRAYDYTSRNPLLKTGTLIKKPISSLTTPVDNPINYLGETGATGKILTSHKLSSFFYPTVSKEICRILQKMSNTYIYISLPIKYNNLIVGVIITGTKNKTISENQKTTLKTFTSQLGLAMGNVMAHERIIEQYKKSLEDKDKPKKKRPKIKFTLRITDDLEQYLSFKTVNTKTSKAEYVRNLLEAEMKNSNDFKEFNKE